jgi:riboflavin synthase
MDCTLGPHELEATAVAPKASAEMNPPNRSIWRSFQAARWPASPDRFRVTHRAELIESVLGRWPEKTVPPGIEFLAVSRAMSAEMFTGIVEATGWFCRSVSSDAGFRATIQAPFTQLGLGESVSVNGVCLTVAALRPDGFEADVSAETQRRTTLGGLPAKVEVNLERAVAVGDRLGGHIVSGHVDGLARVARTEPSGDGLVVSLEAPKPLAPYIAEKGSVTLDGVSLTVNRVSGPIDTAQASNELTVGFELMLVPHTLSVTTLKHLAPGTELNLEVDLVARYVVRWLEATRAEALP